MDRYSRQIRFAGIGQAGQERLAKSRVLLVGCGALGSSLAETLVRAGVGFLRLVDRDFVDLSNLQRQVLYDEQDVAERLPKAIAATRKLERINSTVQIEPHVADVDPRNILQLAEGVDLLLDGLDNFETRFLLNDVAMEKSLPYVYAGVVGSHAQTMTILPGQTACLRCLVDGIPEPGTTPTCDTAGVIAPAIQAITAFQATAVLQILTGQTHLIRPTLTILDVWEHTFRELQMTSLVEAGGCPTCTGGRRDFLRGQATTQSIVLCGRNSVQVAPAEKVLLSLETLQQRLSSLGTATANPFLLRFQPAGEALELTIFRDGRAIVQGTEDPVQARNCYTRYLGN